MDKCVVETIKAEDKNLLRQHIKDKYDVRIIDVQWEKPGLYILVKYSQPCPRGCCYDEVIDAIHVEDYANEIARKIRDLAEDLRHYRILSKA